MFKLLSIHGITDYVSPNDPEKENPTVFKIGALDPMIRAHILDETTTFEVGSNAQNESAKTTLNINKRNLQLVRYGVRGIENITDDTGQQLAYKNDIYNKFGKQYEVMPESVLMLLPGKLIDELAEVVLNNNKLSEQEIKN